MSKFQTQNLKATCVIGCVYALYANSNVGKIPIWNDLQRLIDTGIWAPVGAGQSLTQLSDG